MNKRLEKQVKECLKVNKLLDNARELSVAMYATGNIRVRNSESKIPKIDNQKECVNSETGKKYIEHNYIDDTDSEQYKFFKQCEKERNTIKEYGEAMVTHIESVMWAELQKLSRVIDDSITD